MRATTPVRAPLVRRSPARWTRWVSMQRTPTSRQRVTTSGRAVKSTRSGQGKLSTYCRAGTWGMTWSIRCAAVSTMRRASQDGQNPRFLQEKATRSSCRQPSHFTRMAAAGEIAAGWICRIERLRVIAQARYLMQKLVYLYASTLPRWYSSHRNCSVTPGRLTWWIHA